MHGEDYVCLGFLFGEKSRVAYISDVSRFPPNTEYGKSNKSLSMFYVPINLKKMYQNFIIACVYTVISKSGGGQLDLLILDTLYKVAQIILTR